MTLWNGIKFGRIFLNLKATENLCMRQNPRDFGTPCGKAADNKKLKATDESLTVSK